MAAVKSYIMTIAFFAIFSVPFLLFSLMDIYSIFSLISLFVFTYCFVYKTGFRDQRDGTVGRLGKYKGFICGLIGMIPFVALYFICDAFLPASADWYVMPDIRGLVKHILTGPGYFYISKFENHFTYLISFLVPVLISGLSYIAGLKRIDIDGWIDKNIFKKKEKKEASGMDYLRDIRRK